MRQPFQAAPTFPLRVSQPTRQAEPSDAHPERAFAIREYGRDVVANQTSSLMDQAPLLLIPTAQALWRGHDHIAVPRYYDNWISQEWCKRNGCCKRERRQRFEPGSPRPPDPNRSIAEYPQIALAVSANTTPIRGWQFRCNRD